MKDSDTRRPPRDPGQVRQEAQQIRQRDAEMSKRLKASRSDQRSELRNEWLVTTLDRPSGVVASRPAGFYEPPSFLAKATSRASSDALYALLLEVKDLNDEWEGESTSGAAVVLNGDPRVLQLKAGLRAWAEGYVGDRIRKGNHARDKGNPVATFDRLFYELVPWLEDVTFNHADLTSETSSVHPAVLGEVADFVPWLLFHGTWGGFVETRALENKDSFRILLPDPRERTWCEDYFRLYNWISEGHLPRLATQLGEVSRPRKDPAWIRARLAVLADGIHEMRPLLIRGSKEERNLFEVQPGLWATWLWTLHGFRCAITLANSERNLRERIETKHYDISVGVGVDGVLTNYHLPWLRFDTQELPAGALEGNLALAEAVHDRMLRGYEKIDFDAVLRRYDDAASDDDPSAVEDEAIAASCVRLASNEREGDDDGAEPAESRPRRVTSSPRWTQLESILTTTFGCEVRQGKGSEVTIHRPGRRLFTLGHHKRNPRIPSSTVRVLLSRLGIGTGEWLTAVG